ncbi:MAG: hypothetical protein HOJ35_05290 [Bdellovibrionales bacterium]|jgi:hypothetical protein|nr:hypothetical protein [Bdellovibrionales bacterium]
MTHSLFILVLIIINISSITYAGDEVIYYINPDNDSEESVLNFLVDNYFPYGAIEKPGDKEKIKDNLREWNPHIKKWNNLSYISNIKIKKSYPMVDLIHGQNLVYNEEKFTDSSGISTRNSISNFSFRLKFYMSKNLSVNTNFSYLMQEQLINDDNQYYFPPNYDFRMGFNFESNKSRWSYAISTQLSRYSSLIIPSGIDFELENINDFLTVDTGNVYWLIFSLKHRASIFDRGLYSEFSFGRSIASTKKITSVKFGDTLAAYKLQAQIKQYIINRIWLELKLDHLIYQTEMSGTQSIVGINLGVTL